MWNRNTCYLYSYFYLGKIWLSPLILVVNDFAFFVCTRVKEETNQLCVVILLALEYICYLAASIPPYLPKTFAIYLAAVITFL